MNVDLRYLVIYDLINSFFSMQEPKISTVGLPDFVNPYRQKQDPLCVIEASGLYNATC